VLTILCVKVYLPCNAAQCVSDAMTVLCTNISYSKFIKTQPFILTLLAFSIYLYHRKIKKLTYLLSVYLFTYFRFIYLFSYFRFTYFRLLIYLVPIYLFSY